MKIILNQQEFKALLQTFVQSNFAPATVVTDFEVKGLRTVSGYQLEISTSDIAEFAKAKGFGKLDSKEITEQVKTDDSVDEENITIESVLESMDTLIESISDISDKTPKDEAFTITDVVEAVEATESETQEPSLETVHETSDPNEFDNVDIFGNPLPEVKTFEEHQQQQQENKTITADSLFSN